MATKPNDLAVIIPAHNESKTLAHTFAKLKGLIASKHIYIVDDGSEDLTYSQALRFTNNVLHLPYNRGKGQALNAALKHWHLADKYRYLMPLDADSQVQEDFFTVIAKKFKADTTQQIACITGQVTSASSSWLTYYRIWEYALGQSVHKAAQSALGGIVVCPGCSTVYRSSVFNQTKFPTHSLAEDMDLTFVIHRRQLGKIIYEPKAKVITQDPYTLSDYLKQIDRWYTGLWQNIHKHDVPWGGQMLDVELAILATESLFSGLLYVSFILLVPLSLSVNPQLFVIPLLIDSLLFMLPSMIIIGLAKRRPRLILYFFHFYLLRILSSFIFLISFIKVMLHLDAFMRWFSPRRYTALAKG